MSTGAFFMGYQVLACEILQQPAVEYLPNMLRLVLCPWGWSCSVAA